MSKFVDGSYSSMEDVIHAINALVMRGYDKSSIEVVTNQSKKQELPSDVDFNITTDDSNEVLKSYKSDIQKGNLVIIAEEDSSINDDQSTGATNYDADSPAEDPAPRPDLDSTGTTDGPFDNETPGNVLVGDDDDYPGGIPSDDDNDLTGPKL